MTTDDTWAEGEAYEAFMGRWSSAVAERFVPWLAVPAGGRWLDVGCGTGRLTRAVLDHGSPSLVLGVDPSSGFVADARRRTDQEAARFIVGDGHALPMPAEGFDAAVSGLVLNFSPAPDRMAAAMTRVVRPGGTVGWYVWDYAAEMEMLQYFWDAAVELDPESTELDEAARFPGSRPDPLLGVADRAGLEFAAVRAIDVPTHFPDFEAYWRPFLGGQGPAPKYIAGLPDRRRRRLRERLRSALPTGDDGSITLRARAWAVRGTAPGSGHR